MSNRKKAKEVSKSEFASVLDIRGASMSSIIKELADKYNFAAALVSFRGKQFLLSSQHYKMDKESVKDALMKDCGFDKQEACQTRIVIVRKD